jgi:hypothetical protein
MRSTLTFNTVNLTIAVGGSQAPHGPVIIDYMQYATDSTIMFGTQSESSA